MNKDEWMSAALFSAKKIIARWRKRKAKAFTAEQLLIAVEADIGAAHERRWFGATILALKSAKLIARSGYGPAKTSHGSIKPKYVAVWQR